MSTENMNSYTTVQITENLTAVTCKYHAVAFVDGQLANNGEEASGILINNPYTNEFGKLIVAGESKFAAGAAVTKGDKLTVTTSGWFITATSDDAVVGEAKCTTTSGSLGTGLFNFATAAYPSRSAHWDFTAAETMALAGMAIALNDSKVANNGEEFSGVLLAAATSGTSNGATIVMGGIARGRTGPAVNVGVNVMATLSGYMVAITSGYSPNAQMLETSTSGSLALMFIRGGDVTDFTD